MANSNSIEIEGVVVEALANTMFRVKVSIAPGQETILLGTISGKMRTRYIRILPGDRVKVMVVPPDLTKGKIVYPYR